MAIAGVVRARLANPYPLGQNAGLSNAPQHLDAERRMQKLIALVWYLIDLGLLTIACVGVMLLLFLPAMIIFGEWPANWPGLALLVLATIASWVYMLRFRERAGQSPRCRLLAFLFVFVIPYTIESPLGMPMFLLAVQIADYWWEKHRLKPQQCVVCRYDLTGNVTGQCPECGTPIRPEGASLFGKPEDVPCLRPDPRTVNRIIIAAFIIGVPTHIYRSYNWPALLSADLLLGAAEWVPSHVRGELYSRLNAGALTPEQARTLVDQITSATFVDSVPFPSPRGRPDVVYWKLQTEGLTGPPRIAIHETICSVDGTDMDLIGGELALIQDVTNAQQLYCSVALRTLSPGPHHLRIRATISWTNAHVTHLDGNPAIRQAYGWVIDETYDLVVPDMP